MKLVLAWLAATLVSIASTISMYDLVSEFPNDCAMFCTGTSFLSIGCDLNASCWCQAPNFVSDFGCCIAHMCEEDINNVKDTFNSWCLTASGQGLTPDSTNCSSYDSNPYGTGASSSSSSGSSSTALESTGSYHIIPILAGRVIGGVVVGCLGVLILVCVLCVWLWRRFRVSKDEEHERPPRSRVATPPPPYSTEAPQITELDHSKGRPSASSGQEVV